MTYSLLIVSFTAQRRARSLIDSSSVLGGGEAWKPFITVIVIHHPMLEAEGIKNTRPILKLGVEKH